MKNSFAIFLMVLFMAFVFSSCSNDDDNANSPYAYIKGFSIGDIKSEYPSFTSTGEDTVVIRTIATSGFPFTINQNAGEVYNNDSLPYSTNVSKIAMSMTVEGVAKIYVDSTVSYELFSPSDSIDFTSPRKFKIISIDGNYSKDYTISVNVHKVEPDLMVWDKVARPDGMTPVKAVQFGEDMLLFGAVEGVLSVAMSPVGGEVSWAICAVSGLPSSVNLSALQIFNGSLYAVADGDLYFSSDAISWSACLQGKSLLSAVAASDVTGTMWLASTDSLYTTSDGLTIERSIALPVGFPLYGVSSMSYPLNHNKTIIRSMLVGYATEVMDGNPKVWSRLSTEDDWVNYENTGNPYPCPALKGLTVMRYDNNLYAVGGSGTAGEVTVEPFESFFVSRDNGIVWKAPDNFYQRLPKELKGDVSQFVAAVDSTNRMWIITSGSNASVWRGIINRLGFSKQ